MIHKAERLALFSIFQVVNQTQQRTRKHFEEANSYKSAIKACTLDLTLNPQPLTLPPILCHHPTLSDNQTNEDVGKFCRSPYCQARGPNDLDNDTQEGWSFGLWTSVQLGSSEFSGNSESFNVVGGRFKWDDVEVEVNLPEGLEISDIVQSSSQDTLPLDTETGKVTQLST